MSSIPPEDIETHGHAGLLIGSLWSPPGDPTWVAVIAHGYGEHVAAMYAGMDLRRWF